MTSSITIRSLGQPGDLGWVVMAHGEIYSNEFGWNAELEVLVARIVADYAAKHDDNREAAWIIETDGRRVGCAFCVAKDDHVAQLRTLLVDPAGRGMGLGTQLIRECVTFARAAGYERMTLWTNSVLVAAARLYVAAGFILTSEEPHHSFGADLMGQIYELDLTDPGSGLPLRSDN